MYPQSASSGLARILSRRMIAMIVIVGACGALIYGGMVWRHRAASGGGAGGMEPPAVETVRVEASVWQPELRAVGSLHAVEGADLAAEVSGIVTKLGFHPGEDVPAGALLVQLRDDSDRADLAAKRAEAELARRQFERNQSLLKQGVIARAAYDTSEAVFAAAKAQVGLQEALVAKKSVRAPFSGRVGIRQVDTGQYVAAGQTLVTLQRLDPIYVDFPVPQQQAAMLASGQAVVLTSDAAPGRGFTGKITALDAKADPETRNVEVRAIVDNPGKSLLPGMFATVVISAGSPERRISVPQTAIVYNAYGNSVFVVSPAKKGAPRTVSERFVTTGETRGDRVAILKGLQPGEEVVSAGQIKIQNGMPVRAAMRPANTTSRVPAAGTPAQD